MQHLVHQSDDGSIEFHEFSGKLDADALAQIVREGPDSATSSSVQVFIVDITRAELDHLDSEAVRKLADVASESDVQRKDTRPSLVVVSAPVAQGLAHMFAAYRDDGNPFIFASVEAALAFARNYIADRTAKDEEP